jgi:hypothetical protein
VCSDNYVYMLELLEARKKLERPANVHVTGNRLKNVNVFEQSFDLTMLWSFEAASSGA